MLTVFITMTLALSIAGSVLLILGSLSTSGADTLEPAALTAAPAPTLIILSAVAALLATFGSMWLAGRLLDRRPFADFGFHLRGGWWLDLGFGMLLGALLMLGIFLLELAAGWITVTGTLQHADPAQPFAAALLVPIIVFLCVGIYEEMLTRGYLLLNTAEGLNLRAIGPRGAIIIAWLISSVLFGLAHAFNPNATTISTFNIALAGIFLGLGYVLTGELAIPIGLHITWNFFQGNVFGFPVSGNQFSSVTFIAIEQGGPDLWTGGAFGPEAGLIGLAAMATGCGLTVLWVRFRQGRVALHLPLAEPPAALPKGQATPDDVPRQQATTEHS